MKAEAEDKLHTETARGGFPTGRVVLVLVIIGLVAFFWSSGAEKVEMEPALEPIVEAEVIVEETVLPPAPDIPQLPAPLPAPEAAEPQMAPLPPLAQSDPLVREQMTAAGVGAQLARLQDGDNLVQTGAALVDGFSRGLVLRKLLPLTPPAAAFSVQEEGEQTFMNPDGYSRYDDYAAAITALDPAALVSSFHRLRPLYEEAYSQLGLAPGGFDNAVIRILDQVLATPEIDQPIALTRKSVMWLYASPALEQLSPLQKQLLRMGPDNIRRIKAQARLLRAGLLAPR